MAKTDKVRSKRLRKERIRARIHGTADRPRLSVSITNRHVSAQLINDDESRTIAAATTVGSSGQEALSAQAATVGTEIAKKAKKAKVTRVALDRNGRLYAKRLQAFADAARKEGLEF